jgi:hypothetical protein
VTTRAKLLESAASDSCVPSYHSLDGSEYHLYDQCVRTALIKDTYDIFNKLRADGTLVASLWDSTVPEEVLESSSGYRFGDYTRGLFTRTSDRIKTYTGISNDGPRDGGKLWSLKDFLMYTANHGTDNYQKGVEDFVDHNPSTFSQRFHQSENTQFFMSKTDGSDIV